MFVGDRWRNTICAWEREREREMERKEVKCAKSSDRGTNVCRWSLMGK